MIVTFTGLVKAFCLLVLSLATIIAARWPKNKYGQPMSFEEVAKLAKKEKGNKIPTIFLFTLFSTFTIFALLLS